MLRKLVYGAALCAALVTGASTAKAVTIDLSSPQDGGIVYPGDTVELTVTVTNNTDEMDFVHVTLTMTVEGLPHSVVAKGKFRLKMEPWEVVSNTVSAEIPAGLEVPGPATVTIEGVAYGRKSQTEDSDSVSATIMPLP